MRREDFYPAGEKLSFVELLSDHEVLATVPSGGNVHSADDWRAVLEPVIARYRGTVKRLYFRGDAAFANPEMHEYLETENIDYTIRCRSTMSCSAGSAIC